MLGGGDVVLMASRRGPLGGGAGEAQAWRPLTGRAGRLAGENGQGLRFFERLRWGHGSRSIENSQANGGAASCVTGINCKDIITSHGGYRSSGQVWAFMAQELTSPANEQFVTLKKTPEALTTVFHATGGRVHAVTTTPARRRSPAGSRRRAATGRRSGR